MKKIQLLDNATINQIAAGEVVEAPKSVVKELVENAMDAGATAITIEIRDGGISYLRITDNGSGIPKEEVGTAFVRHATSKIETIDDLAEVSSMGFRGEALASIAAVAQVELLTKTSDEAIGTQLLIEGGAITQVADTACLNGTTIVVRNLFYNLPARRKFLKKPSAEAGAISDIVHKLALGHPNISFQYINNKTTLLQTTGNNDLKTALFHVYGKEMVQRLLPLSFTRDGYTLTGLIGAPELARANRSYEILFLNGRWIRDTIISSAVEEAYKTRILGGKFPVYCLHFSLSPSWVDVNVHPAKLAVRFHDEDAVYQFFYDAISTTLGRGVLIPKVGWGHDRAAFTKPTAVQQSLEEETREEPSLKVHSVDTLLMPKEKASFVQETSGISYTAPSISPSTTESLDREEKKETPPSVLSTKSIDDLLEWDSPKEASTEQKEPILLSKEKSQPAFLPFFTDYRIIGQAFSTYWMIEQKGSLYLIDQHAAHERILYEELMERFRNNTVVSQKLLEPWPLTLTQTEEVVLEDNLSLLEGFGFILERLGKVFALTATPFLMTGQEGAGFFIDILDILGEAGLSHVADTKITAVATMACKAAVKGHDRLSFQEAEALIRRLLRLENPFTCPHGRPTIIEMTQYELEKKFKRIQT